MAEVTFPCYWQKKDNSGHCTFKQKSPGYWIYYAKNGEAISRSSESYVNRSDCTHSIDLMKASTKDPVFYTE